MSRPGTRPCRNKANVKLWSFDSPYSVWSRCAALDPKWVACSHGSRLTRDDVGTTYSLPGCHECHGSSKMIAASYCNGSIATTRQRSIRPRTTHREGPCSCNSTRTPGLMQPPDSTSAPPELRSIIVTSWSGRSLAPRDHRVASGATLEILRRSVIMLIPRATAAPKGETEGPAGGPWHP